MLEMTPVLDGKIYGEIHEIINEEPVEEYNLALMPAGAVETDFSYEFASHFDYHARGVLYYAIISSVKNYGSATFYLDLAETPDGEWLEGGKNYKLVVPPNVPVRDFWAIMTYDLETASYLRVPGVPKLNVGARENSSNDQLA